MKRWKLFTVMKVDTGTDIESFIYYIIFIYYYYKNNSNNNNNNNSKIFHVYCSKSLIPEELLLYLVVKEVFCPS